MYASIGALPAASHWALQDPTGACRLAGVGDGPRRTIRRRRAMIDVRYESESVHSVVTSVSSVTR